MFCGHDVKLLIVKAKIFNSYFNAIGFLNLNEIAIGRNFFRIGYLNA